MCPESSIPLLPPLPARSRLIALPPCGVGTVRTESLTGYVTRLAKAHQVSTGSLLKWEIHKHLHKDDPGSRIILSPIYLRSMNGLDAVAATWTRALRELTCRSDLQCLTMFTWADVLSSRGLLRRNRAWCPSCYEEDAEPYEHLLWCLEPVQVCPHHYLPLETRCPHCRLGLPIISWRSVPGFCSSCLGWLGVSPSRSCMPDNNRSAEETGLNDRTALSLGELIARAPSLKDAPSRERIIHSLVALIGYNHAGVIASRLGINYVTAWTWSTKGVRLLVGRLLLVCEKLNVSVADFLTSDTFAPSSAIVEGTLVAAAPDKITNSLNQPKTRKRRSSLCLFGRAKKHLERVLKADVLPPPTLSAVCRVGGYTKPYMYRHFPTLCREISRRWMDWRQMRGAERRALLASEVRGAAAQLHDEGIDPSTLNVARLLHKPGSIRDLAARRALQEFRRQIGL